MKACKPVYTKTFGPVYIKGKGISLLLAQVFYPFSKSMLNRKMVFRVTKSKSMKDKISFIWCHMIILWWGGVWGVVWLDGGEGGQYV